MKWPVCSVSHCKYHQPQIHQRRLLSFPLYWTISISQPPSFGLCSQFTLLWILLSRVHLLYQNDQISFLLEQNVQSPLCIWRVFLKKIFLLSFSFSYLHTVDSSKKMIDSLKKEPCLRAPLYCVQARRRRDAPNTDGFACSGFTQGRKWSATCCSSVCKLVTQ